MSTFFRKSNVFFKFRLPDVYTQFRKRVEAESPIRPLLSTPDRFKPLPDGIDMGDIPTYQSFGQPGMQLTY